MQYYQFIKILLQYHLQYYCRWFFAVRRAAVIYMQSRFSRKRQEASIVIFYQSWSFIAICCHLLSFTTKNALIAIHCHLLSFNTIFCWVQVIEWLVPVTGSQHQVKGCHNKSIIRIPPLETIRYCNCVDRRQCPMDNKCLSKNIVY